jgi:O-methyltransferase domain/Dimerisation domain
MGGNRACARHQANLQDNSMIAGHDVNTSTITPNRIIELGYGYRAAKTLLSAVELGVFTVLAETSLDGDTLRRRLGLDQRGARDFFDALFALGLLKHTADGRYANSPDADIYLDRRKPTYVGGLLENLGVREYGMWDSLTAALRSGKPQTGFEEKQHFGNLYSDPKRLDFFVKGMTGATLPVATALASVFPWRSHGTIIDIGTAEGCLPVEIARAYPHIIGGGFDLPEIKPQFESYVAKRGLSERLRFHPGNFFNDSFPAADVIVLGRVLHNWDLPTKKMLLGKAHTALPPGGAIIVYERLIDNERNANASALLSSLNMLIMTAGGFDFTAADCIGWMREIGFHAMRVEPLAAGHSMVVGTK